MLKAIIPDDTLYAGQQISLLIYKEDEGDCYLYIQWYAKYSVEIINGSEYGSLIDPVTNERTKLLTNLSHNWGEVNFDLIADGKTPDTVDSIVIRVSTDLSYIMPKDFVIYINPSPIWVYTDPEIVSASDTAEVIIKKRNPDGTLEDFPVEQTFELSVVDGCINGNIFVGDSLGVYFSSAQQPIYFAAADSVEGDSGYVRLRVGTDLDDAAMVLLTKVTKNDIEFNDEQEKLSELRAGYDKIISERKAELSETNNTTINLSQSDALVADACYTGSYLYETGYWEGDVVVEDDVVCDTTRPLLIDDIKNTVITQVTASMFNVTVKADNDSGCYEDNDNQGGWAIAYVPPFTGNEYKYYLGYFYIDEMIFSLSWGFCTDEINVTYSNPILIDDQNGVLTGIQNINEKEDIIKDFYGILDGEIEGRGIKYYPLPKTREHELMHISQYKDSLKYYYDKALDKINWIKAPPCDWHATLESTEKYFNERLALFKLYLQVATNDFDNSNKAYKEKYESEADEVGLEYLRNTLIPKVKNFPY